MNQPRRAKQAPDFVVNPSNGALVNTNNTALDSYKKKKAHNKKLAQHIDRVEQLEKDVSDIKLMLAQILQRL